MQHNNFTTDEMERLVLSTVEAASAPSGSQKWCSVPRVVTPLLEKGTTWDAWVFICGLAHCILDDTGIRDIRCPCGNPDHLPEMSFGLIPVDERTGRPDPGRIVLGDEEFADEALRVPTLLARLVTAELRGDAQASAAACSEAIRFDCLAELISFAVVQAGESRRYGQHATRVN